MDVLRYSNDQMIGGYGSFDQLIPAAASAVADGLFLFDDLADLGGPSAVLDQVSFGMDSSNCYQKKY